MPELPPTLIFFAAAIIAGALRGKARALWCCIVPIISFAVFASLPDDYAFTVSLMGETLTVFEINPIGKAFGYIFHLVAFCGGLYMFHMKSGIEFWAGTAYAGAAIGVAHAGDLFSLFVHWEMLTILAGFLIVAPKTKESLGAGYRYVLVHVVGGLILLAGICLHVHDGLQAGLSFEQAAAFGEMQLDSLGNLLIFLGFGVNCGWPLLHAWLPDAYPAVGIGGILFCSAFTTKTAVYALCRGFPGVEPLVWIGMAMCAFPIFYAVVENDLRRVLVYSMINQIGYMVVAIGLADGELKELGQNAAVATAFNHILYKGLLFLSVGAVVHQTGRAKATELGGLYKSMPWTCLFCCVGAASISAFPLFSGFASKSLVMATTATAAEGSAAYVVVWLVLLFAAAGVFHHAGIKIPFFAFFGHDAGHRVKEAPKNMLIAMGIFAAGCFITGTFPHATVYQLVPHQSAELLAHEGAYHVYSGSHVVTQLQLLFYSALAFALLMLSGIYPPEIRSVNVDVDVLYRKGSRYALRVIDGPLTRIGQFLARLFGQQIPKVAAIICQNPVAILELTRAGARLAWHRVWAKPDLGIVEQEFAELREQFPGNPARAWPVGLTVVGAVGFLLLWLVLTYAA